MKNLASALFCFFLTLPVALLAGNILDRTGNPTATPLVVFSLRQLSSAYTGKAIQVRRSSDNTTKDIGFTTAGDLDTMALKAFVSTGDGYVSIWYDQSGNGYNATQTTISIQPIIISSGMINRDNGQPSVYTAGGNGYLSYGPISQLNGATQVTRMEVARSRSSSFGITEGLGTFQLDLQLFPDQVMVQYETGNITVSGAVPSTTTLMAINSVRNSGASQLYINTILQGTNTTVPGAFSSPVTGYIGVRFDFNLGNDGPGAFSETILFNTVLSDADRQAINYNQNWYYTLGFYPCSSTQAKLSPNGTTTKTLYACTQDGPWAYYYDPAHPLNLLFGLAKDPGSTNANPAFTVDSINLTVTANPSTIYYSATSGMEGIFALGRYWNVYTRSTLANPVNVRFFYDPADTVAARNAALAFKSSTGASKISSLQWFKTIGGPFTPDSLTAMPTANVKGPKIILTPIYGTKDGVNYAEFDGIASFSGGTGIYIVSNTFTTLPVIIDPFTARRTNGTTVLSWTTRSESNSKQFEIERSTDGTAWTNIGETPAAGNSTTPLSYQFADPVPLQQGNTLHYRLKLEDKDGKYTYSGVVVVASYDGLMIPQPLCTIAPNPMGNELEITCTVPASGPVEVLLRDMAGVTLIHRNYTANKGSNVWKLTDLNGLAQGMYVVQVLQGVALGISKAIKL